MRPFLQALKIKAMHKIVNIGTVPAPDGRTGRAEIFCKINTEAGKLSISGVIGPLKNGNARGSCGQIADDIREAMNAGEIKRAAGWEEKPDTRGEWTGTEYARVNDPLVKFINVWDRWHLNDMRAACEHQRAAGWEDQARETIKIYQWRLKPEISAKKKDLEAEALERAKSTEAGRSLGFYAQDREILKLEQFIKTNDPELSPGDLARFYEACADRSGYFAHIEEKARGWTTWPDDPRGLLGKPCEVCGYRYGSEWKREELPAGVVEWLEALPETEKTPAWI